MDDNKADIYHTTGYKDDYMVTVEFDEPQDSWNPTNDQIFRWIRLWFESEDHEFGDGYGRWMPFFYIALIAIGEEEKAQEAYGLRGTEALDHFRDCLDEHRGEVIEALESL
jgi:hypothetical protein